VTADNGIGAAASQSFTVTVNQAPAFTSKDTVNFAGGSADTFQATASGYPTPTFSVQGSLPTGVTLSPDGVLSGVPSGSAGRQYFITLVASNGIGNPAHQLFSLNVDTPIHIVSRDMTVFPIGRIDNWTLKATGFPAASYSVTGTLPGGVSFLVNKFTGVPTGKAPVAPTTAPAVTSPSLTTTSGKATRPAAVPMRYPLTIAASNGIGAADHQTFEIILSRGKGPTVGVPVPRPVLETVIGAKKPVAVPERVFCASASCRAELVIQQVMMRPVSHRIVVGRRTITQHTLQRVVAVFGVSVVASRHGDRTVRIVLNKNGEKFFAAGAAAHRVYDLSLVEHAGPSTYITAVRVRA
jgi:hypothetical protein